MNLEQIATFSVISILILTTSTMALADESLLVKSAINSELAKNVDISPRGYVNDISWVKQVSRDGVIEIKGISFSVVNEDNKTHLFENLCNHRRSFRSIHYIFRRIS